MKPELAIKYYRNEYEQLRRKKNKEIEDLQVKLSRGSALFLKYLEETNQLERYFLWNKKDKEKNMKELQK